MAQLLRKPAPPPTVDPTEFFKQRLGSAAADTEALLDQVLAPVPVTGEIMRPQRLLDAMRYSSLGGGKRFRPFLVTQTAALFDVPRGQALMAAAALECVHCYSLIHDDLPAMDNDALRRGRPTAHVAFDEATAILSGDSLLTFAFDVLSRPQTHPDAAVRIDLISALARGAGLGGMAGGQMLDLTAEGRFANHARQTGSLHDVQTLQAMKTGALIRFACRAGAILGRADRMQHAALDRYGVAVGEAFQIADDLLDIFGDPTEVGKNTGKDEAAQKATFISVLGVDGARQRLAALVAEAETALAPFGAAAEDPPGGGAVRRRPAELSRIVIRSNILRSPPRKRGPSSWQTLGPRFRGDERDRSIRSNPVLVAARASACRASAQAAVLVSRSISRCTSRR